MFEETEVWERGLSQKHLHWREREQPTIGAHPVTEKRSDCQRRSQEGTFRNPNNVPGGVRAIVRRGSRVPTERMDHIGIPHLWSQPLWWNRISLISRARRLALRRTELQRRLQRRSLQLRGCRRRPSQHVARCLSKRNETCAHPPAPTASSMIARRMSQHQNRKNRTSSYLRTVT